jgi:hypothetical protein
MERIVLVHLSDIHMGSIRNGFYTPAALRAGWNGHDPLLLGRLQQALLDIPSELKMSKGERLHYLVSGDLTCTGLDTDFVLAQTYLLGKLVTDNTGFTVDGLNIPADQLRTIPGNHDHWDGKHGWPQPAYDAGVFGASFVRTPWKTRPSLQSPSGALRLDLFGVDSNSGLFGWPENYTALGMFSHGELFQPLRGLEALLQESEADRKVLPKGVVLVRGIVCHHAFSNNAQQNRPKIPGWRARLSRSWSRVMQRFFGKNPDPLDPASVTALINLAHKYDVRAVLTGHTHYFHDERFPPRGQAGAFVWELRSHTALQGPMRDCEQGFYLHEISLDGSLPAPVWKYRQHEYGTNRFHPGPWLTAN